jgi:hypothetical protein
MRTFTFATTPELDAYFDKVVDVMVRDFGVSEDEAVGRVNRTFGGYDVLGDKYLTHEWARDTAYQIYYGPDQMYWKPGATLTPVPYP